MCEVLCFIYIYIYIKEYLGYFNLFTNYTEDCKIYIIIDKAHLNNSCSGPTGGCVLCSVSWILGGFVLVWLS